MNTLQAVRFTCFVCIWSFGRARSSKCILLVSFRARRARAHTHTRAQTHTHTHTRAQTHTHTHTRAQTHTHTHTRAQTHTHTHTHARTHFSLRKSVSPVDCTFNVLLSNMSSNLVTVKTAFYNNRQTIDLILMLSFGQGGTNARRCEEKEEETRL